jgi:hypothetical protein
MAKVQGRSCPGNSVEVLGRHYAGCLGNQADSLNGRRRAGA